MTGQKKDLPAQRAYLRELRRALNHLYDPNVLRASPLCAALGLSSASNPYAALREALSEAIASLKPGPDVPAHSHLWRTYEILLYRYVQQCSQAEVADQLGISVRHLRREQRDALEVLGQRLVERYSLDITNLAQTATAMPSEEDSPIEEDTRVHAVESELAWLRMAPTGEPLEVAAVLAEVMNLCRPIAARHGVALELANGGDDAVVRTHPVALRQILLSLLTLTIRCAEEGAVTIAISDEEGCVRIIARCCAALCPEDKGILTMLRRLLDVCEGQIRTWMEGKRFCAEIRLPRVRQNVVLVLDDNQDTLKLFERYSADTEWRVVGTSDPVAVFALAEEVQPAVIVLDVMMPQLDGWTMLGRLAEHPSTGHIPIVVCTILPHEELALSLGVSGFLQKPVSRDRFLATLRDLAGQPKSG
ncbi:MAG: response regulator [Chloroflexi bacterium]|nr:response regulator [Chloroflexota bacterium]